MKKLIHIILFLLIGTVIHAQDVSEAQRNKALSVAGYFCSLLSQYSSNGDEAISNDEKIFELCSSPNITAFNDLDGQKEDLLVSYLFTILGDHGCMLDMTFTKPVIEQIFSIPIFDPKTDYSGELSCEVVGYADTYIVLGTTQKIGRLDLYTSRKIIYSCNENKIIAFTISDSPFITLQMAFKAFSLKDYESVMAFVDKVLMHLRFDPSAKQDAATIALLSAILSDHPEEAGKYADMMSNNKGMLYYLLALSHLKKDNFREGLSFMEQSSIEGYEHANPILALYYFGPDFGIRDLTKAKAFFEKGLNSKNDDVVGLTAFYCGVMSLNYEDFPLSDRNSFSYFKLSAENEYDQSYLPLSILYEQKGDFENASIWDEKAANAGSKLAVARLGKYLLSSPNADTRSRGMSYLQEAAYADVENEISNLVSNTGLEPGFPKNMEEIRNLISKY